MLKNVDLEQVAIDQYREHIAAIDNEHMRLVLGRILHDELVHKEQFAGLAEAVRSREEAEQVTEPNEAECGEPKGPPARLAEILNQGIRHEYSVILQYIYHSLVTDDKELGEELMNAAINEMQHMGWLSEEMTGHGGDPEMEHHELFLSRDPIKNLKADIAIEQLVIRDYTNQISELEEPDLQALLARIRDHEVFHDAFFKHLLEEAEGKTVEPEAETMPEEPESVTAPAEPVEPGESEPQPPPSVGSLITND